MKASEVLRDALLRLDGGNRWVKKSYCDLAGRHCAKGAIEEVGGYAGWHTRYAAQFLSSAIGGRAIEPWNDAPERTFGDVEAAFQKAIELAEKDEQAA